jgi:uncharacterized protein YecE (DUF72 family)
MTKGEIHIGTSGWHYKHWAGTFYPDSIMPNEQFEFYAKSFTTVEINNSFYRLPTPEIFTRWRKESPRNFIFVIKASRYITHQKKLKDPKQSTRKFFDNVKYLKDKLGAILFQLPPMWNVNVERFEAFLKVLPRKYRYAFEFRNDTWYTDEIFRLLKKYKCAFCTYELAGHTAPAVITADFVYLRLHGPGNKYQGCYTESQLLYWAKQVTVWRRKGLDVFVYFDNDQLGYAAHNALHLKQIVKG